MLSPLPVIPCFCRRPLHEAQIVMARGDGSKRPRVCDPYLHPCFALLPSNLAMCRLWCPHMKKSGPGSMKQNSSPGRWELHLVRANCRAHLVQTWGTASLCSTRVLRSLQVLCCFCWDFFEAGAVWELLQDTSGGTASCLRSCSSHCSESQLCKCWKLEVSLSFCVALIYFVLQFLT